MGKLTEISVRNARPTDGPILLSDGGCLFLRCYATRTGLTRAWVVRLKRQGERRVHSIGRYPELDIKAARAKAAQLVARKRGDVRMSVSDAVDEFMETMIRPEYKRVANPEVYARRLQNRIGNLSLDKVEPSDVSHLVKSYKRGAPVAAARCLSFAKNFFKWCVGTGYLKRSPLSDITADAFRFDEKPRARVLTDDEVRAFWHADDLPHRALLRFLLLTGVRIGEAQVAQREWLGADGWLALPADVMKNGKPHRVYVSPLARQQIEPEATPALFRAVSPTAVQSAVHRWHDRNKVESRWKPHDLRRSFASRLGDLNIAIHVIAKCLSHTLAGGGESTAVYVKSEWFAERQAAATLLAKHIAGLVGAGHEGTHGKR